MNPFSWLFGPPTRDQFARSMLAEFRRLGDTRDLRYEPEEFRLKSSEGEVNLGNLYHEYSKLPRKDRASHLRRVVEGFLAARTELPESFEDARPNLRPKIWTRATFTELELRQRINGGKPIDPPLYPLGSHLVSTVVYDMPTAMRSLSNEDFDKWNVTYYEALEAACQNLSETSVALARIGERFHSAVSGDNYDSSRVLLKDQIASWDVLGDHVAMVPQRDAFYVTGTKDDTGLKIMLSLTSETIKSEARPLSPIPLRLVDGEWEDWMVPRTHELYPQFKELETGFLGNLYADQKTLLTALHEKEEIDVFVASYSGIKKEETAEVLTYCVWTKGIESLLPKTDLVMLGAGEDSMLIGEWRQIAQVVGDLMQLDDNLYPPRYRVGEFPSAEQLAQIVEFEL